MKLTIAIPTYNRAKRLEKALLDVFYEVNGASNKTDVAVYVSNNGSKDDTVAVIDRCAKQFVKNSIPFSSKTADCNQGFDANVLACYAECNSEYIWFLSDDDNIIPGALDLIINSIKIYSPSVVFYNFEQKPYDRARPYINESEYFNRITDNNIIALQKIINWPKLSALVIKKCVAGQQVVNQHSGFAHVALALQCGLREGGILHSPVFVACPDVDYKDHIDFVPYIGNNLDMVICLTLQVNNRMSLYKQLAVPYVDPFISSLNTLGAYYRGRFVLTLPLKRVLWEAVHEDIRNDWFNRLLDWKSVKELLKLMISLAYGIGYTLTTRKKLTKDRINLTDN